MLKNRSFARCRREMRSGVGGEERGEDAFSPRWER